MSAESTPETTGDAAVDDTSRSTWLRKMPGLAALVEGSHWCAIDERVRPHADEPVWTKPASSAFFGAPMHDVEPLG